MVHVVTRSSGKSMSTLGALSYGAELVKKIQLACSFQTHADLRLITRYHQILTRL
jgi:hypothetical protein